MFGPWIKDPEGLRGYVAFEAAYFREDVVARLLTDEELEEWRLT